MTAFKQILCLVAMYLSLGVGFSLRKFSSSAKVTITPRTICESQLSREDTMRLWGNPKGRAWAKGDLSDKDIFEDADTPDGEGSKKKDKVKLEPETVFFEGAPSPIELVLPGLSVLTVIGLVPFASALSRQAWVRYKFTSRRISIQSGFGGKTTTEIIYPDIEEVRFVYRAFGTAGDMVLFLKDGAKVELRFVPNFTDVYTYMLGKCDDECRAKSMKLTIKKEE
jgi:hypothetical protein